MDLTVKTLENTPDNIAEIERLGYVKSSVSKPNGLNKVLRYSVKRGVYWFTNKWVARKIEAEMNRSQVGTLIFI